MLGNAALCCVTYFSCIPLPKRRVSDWDVMHDPVMGPPPIQGDLCLGAPRWMGGWENRWMDGWMDWWWGLCLGSLCAVLWRLTRQNVLCSASLHGVFWCLCVSVCTCQSLFNLSWFSLGLNCFESSFQRLQRNCGILFACYFVFCFCSVRRACGAEVKERRWLDGCNILQPLCLFTVQFVFGTFIDIY